MTEQIQIKIEVTKEVKYCKLIRKRNVMCPMFDDDNKFNFDLEICIPCTKKRLKIE